MADLEKIKNIGKFVEDFKRKHGSTPTSAEVKSLVSTLESGFKDLNVSQKETQRLVSLFIGSQKNAYDKAKDLISSLIQREKSELSNSAFSVGKILKTVEAFRFPEVSDLTERITKSVVEAIRGLRLSLPNTPDNPVAVRISDGEKFIDTLTTVLHDGMQRVVGGGGSTPKVRSTVTGQEAVPVVNPDGTNISASGGGGGAVTVADGADIAQGTTSDASSANTVIGLLKNLKAALAGSLTVIQATGSNLHTVIDSGTLTTLTNLTNVPRSLSGPGQPGTAIDSYTHLAINLTTGNDQVLVSSAPNKQIWVYGITFTTSVAGTVSFQDEDNTAITGIMPFATNSGLGIPPSGNFSMPIWKLATDKDLEVDIVTCDVDGYLDYAIVSV